MLGLVVTSPLLPKQVYYREIHLLKDSAEYGSNHIEGSLSVLNPRLPGFPFIFELPRLYTTLGKNPSFSKGSYQNLGILHRSQTHNHLQPLHLHFRLPLAAPSAETMAASMYEVEREDPSKIGAGVEESICLNPLYRLRAVAFSVIQRNLLGV